MTTALAQPSAPVSATALLNSCTETLRAALATPMRTGPDFDLVPGPWTSPTTVSPDMRAEAAALAESLEAVMRQPAKVESLRRWLTELGATVAVTMDASEAAMRIAAMANVLDDVPAAILTRATLKDAAKRFTFWPTAKELVAFFDAKASDVRDQQKRARRIAAIGKPATAAPDPGRPAADMTPEERAAFCDSVMAKFRATSNRQPHTEAA